jgi:folate-binding Fe-S cluster repair protein YgfZ
MDSLTEEQSILGAQCTPKGRIVYLFKASLDADGRILLETHNSVTDIAITSLKKYAVFFKTEITQIPAPADITPITDLERLRNGMADITAETTDMFIPQMINLDALGYISFKKRLLHRPGDCRARPLSRRCKTQNAPPEFKIRQFASSRH